MLLSMLITINMMHLSHFEGFLRVENHIVGRNSGHESQYEQCNHYCYYGIFYNRQL